MTNVSKQIVKMLKENTGRAMMDSGDAYGRHWENNQKIDFEKTEKMVMAVDGEGKDYRLSFSLSVYHLLNETLDSDDFTAMVNRAFTRFCKTEEQTANNWLCNIKDFAEEKFDSYGLVLQNSFNTYNGDSLFSQVLQGYFVSRGEKQNYPEYVFIQIHNGCDVRGGYTKPVFFKVKYEQFVSAETDVNLACKCNTRYSDDCGYHWYSNSNDDGLPDSWIAENGILKCTNCKSEVKATGGI